MEIEIIMHSNILKVLLFYSERVNNIVLNTKFLLKT